MLIKADDLTAFFAKCRDEGFAGISEVILPEKSVYNSDLTFLTVLNGQSGYMLDGFRSVDPVKILFYKTREVLSPEKYENKKRIIAGIKACDLKALEMMDKALINEDFTDPSYYHWRKNSYIISCDCTDITSACFCNLHDENPFPTKGFDINLTPVDDYFMLTAGTEAGEELLSLIQKEFTLSEISETQSRLAEEQRRKIRAKLDEQNSMYNFDSEKLSLVKADQGGWKEESGKCVGCGACTNICPTCYCLILNDESSEESFIKVRSYDSCQYNGYARVAGGGTPRPEMSQRFRNRYLCKMVYMKENPGIDGCTGCGRCIDACPANIDMRRVITELKKEPVLTSGVNT